MPRPYALILLLCLATFVRHAAAAELELKQIGVNLAGGEFGKAPGIFRKDYIYPGKAQFDYCQQKGFKLIRLPFKWERIQPELMGALNEEELRRLDEVATLARQRGMSLLLDMHNYARYGGKLIGTDDVPIAAYADVWMRLARHYRDEQAVVAFGIMNEPHDTQGLWPAAAQACVDAIRTVDRQHIISVCGDGWSGAHSWRKYNEKLLLHDPANRLIYEAHQYFDRDSSGTYKRSYDDDGATEWVGVKRLQPFIDWLQEHRVQGFLGEFGVPDNDARWLVVLDNTLAQMQKHGLGGTYWAAGPWWNNYPLSLEPREGQDRPQMAVLAYYLGQSAHPDSKPWVAEAQAAAVAAQQIRAEDARLGRRIFDFRTRNESYHYANEGSAFASQAAADDDRPVRKIAFQHHGEPAWIGVGLYFGNLNCEGHAALRLDVRAENACRLEIKAYSVDGQKFTAAYDVSAKWQMLEIPFADLKNSDRSFAATMRIQKIELQPSISRAGNVLYLGALRLAPSP